MFLVAGWLLACYVSGLAVLLLGRGPLGGWAYSVVSPALSRMFALAILMVGGWVFLVSRPAWAIAALLALGWSRSDCSRARHASNTC